MADLQSVLSRLDSDPDDPHVLAGLAEVTAAAASADVGPPPTCPEGQHDEYNMGHHCVPDNIAPTPATEGSGADAGSATGASAGSDVAKPAPVVSKRGCGCQTSDGSTGALAFVGTLFVGLAITRRARK